ncbi:MAG: hypothetical protein ACFFAS_12845 [Promethearchaeota archaeon]
MTIISPINFAIGMITLIFLVMSGASVSLMMFRKYYKYKEKHLLNLGWTWNFLSSIWWGDTITFYLMLFLGDEFWLPDPIFFFLKFTFIFPIFYLWPPVFGDLMLDKKRNLKSAYIWGAAIYGTLLEISFLVLFFLNYNNIGVRNGPYSAEWGFIAYLYMFSIIIIFIIPGIFFSQSAANSEKKDIKIKGETLFFSFITLGFAIALEFLFFQFDLLNLIARIFYIQTALTFYFGFTLPKIMRKVFKID